jgi:hypothetical protein
MCRSFNLTEPVLRSGIFHPTYYWGNEIISPVITGFQAVLLAPYGATAKHGTSYSGKFTFLNGIRLLTCQSNEYSTTQSEK